MSRFPKIRSQEELDAMWAEEERVKRAMRHNQTAETIALYAAVSLAGVLVVVALWAVWLALP